MQGHSIIVHHTILRVTSREEVNVKMDEEWIDDLSYLCLVHASTLFTKSHQSIYSEESQPLIRV